MYRHDAAAPFSGMFLFLVDLLAFAHVQPVLPLLDIIGLNPVTPASDTPGAGRQLLEHLGQRLGFLSIFFSTLFLPLQISAVSTINAVNAQPDMSLRV